MESTHSALRTQINALETELSAAKRQISSLQLDNARLQAAHTEIEGELREAESLRRKLHNEVQELRGNIRVFCRVRPSVRNDTANAAAQGASDTALATIRFPNEREAQQIELIASGESATGTATMSKHHFQFDRVFQPNTSQAEVFEEVAHLTQSVLDGYNVSRFCRFSFLTTQLPDMNLSHDKQTNETRRRSSHTAKRVPEKLTRSRVRQTASSAPRLAARHQTRRVSSRARCRCCGVVPRCSRTRGGGTTLRDRCSRL